jgi:hypothetical protein
MFSTRTRTVIIALAASASFAAASVAPTVSQARPKRGPGRIEVDCYLIQNDGTTVWYPEGKEIVVTDLEGNVHVFKCVNGSWVYTARMVTQTGVVAPIGPVAPPQEGTSPISGTTAMSSPSPAL